MIKYLLHALTVMMLSLFLSACAQEETEAINPTQDEEQALLPFDIIDNGKMSGVTVDKTTLYMFNDQATFKEFWTRHMTVTPATAPPSVDFKTRTLFAIVDSSQPNGGYYLSFDKAERTGDELWLYVTRQQPSTECMNMGMIAQPYVIVTVDKTELKSKLVFKTNHYPC